MPGFAGLDAGGYIFGCFLAFFSGCFFGVVFRCPGTFLFGFRVPLGVSRVFRTSFFEEILEFPNFWGGSKSMAGAMF